MRVLVGLLITANVLLCTITAYSACGDGCYLHKFYNRKYFGSYETSQKVCIHNANTAPGSSVCPNLDDLTGSCSKLIELTRWTTQAYKCCDSTVAAVKAQNQNDAPRTGATETVTMYTKCTPGS